MGDSDSITRLLNEAVEASDAEEQAVVSVQQSNSDEINADPSGRRGNTRPRLFRPNALRSRLRQRLSIQINTLAPEALIETTTTERPSRSSLFSSPRRRFRPRPRKEEEKKEQEVTTTEESSNEAP